MHKSIQIFLISVVTFFIYLPAYSVTSTGVFLYAQGRHNNILGDGMIISAEHAFYSLVTAGYIKEDIKFIASEDAIPSYYNKNLDGDKQVIQAIRSKDDFSNALKDHLKNYDNILIYITAHGSGEYNPDDSGFIAASYYYHKDLLKLINDYATSKNKKVTLILESCHSGSILNHIGEHIANLENIIVIATSDANNNSLFSANGVQSFSQVFFNEIAQGRNLKNAFAVANEYITSYESKTSSITKQNPQINISLDGYSDCLIGIQTCNNNEYLILKNIKAPKPGNSVAATTQSPPVPVDSYDVNKGLLSLMNVSYDGKKYSATLRNIQKAGESEIPFQLLSGSASNYSQAPTSEVTSNGTLKIYRVQVGDKFYKVTMTLVPGSSPLTFKLSTLQNFK